uniref:Uncharacterized protein n=1 Tax=Coccolithus braarudii TaxID=221442 RepID=A0A7S0Q6Y7_9EUKA|mmetsp:Transcript_41354/g.88225  ORF Transcript_41354/g.88225 Transcript_41354/m.88225 type:complete len:154 (+) Transcript_41354:15-476(+)
MAAAEEDALSAFFSQAIANVTALSLSSSIPTVASVAYSLSSAIARITHLSLGCSHRFYETEVKRRVVAQLREEFAAASIRPHVARLDELLHAELLSTRDVDSHESHVPLRTQLHGELLASGPILTEQLMLGWVVRTKLPSCPRDLVCHALRFF